MGAGLLAESEYDSTNSAFVLPNRRENMMIIKNDIPILEYDDSSPEVIPPDHDIMQKWPKHSSQFLMI